MGLENMLKEWLKMGENDNFEAQGELKAAAREGLTLLQEGEKGEKTQQQTLEQFIAQSEELLQMHNWLRTIPVFAGNNNDYFDAYGKRVVAIEIPKIIPIKAVTIGSWEFQIYDPSSLSVNKDGFPYKTMDLRYTGNVNPAWLKQQGMVALLNAQFIPNLQNNTFENQFYFGTPVRLA